MRKIPDNIYIDECLKKITNDFLRELISQVYIEIIKIDTKSKLIYQICECALMIEFIIAVISEFLVWELVVEYGSLKIKWFVLSAVVIITIVFIAFITVRKIKKYYSILLNNMTCLQEIQGEIYCFILCINDYETLNASKRQVLFEERFGEIIMENNQSLNKLLAANKPWKLLKRGI